MKEGHLLPTGTLDGTRWQWGLGAALRPPLLSPSSPDWKETALLTRRTGDTDLAGEGARGQGPPVVPALVAAQLCQNLLETVGVHKEPRAVLTHGPALGLHLVGGGLRGDSRTSNVTSAVYLRAPARPQGCDLPDPARPQGCDLEGDTGSSTRGLPGGWELSCQGTCQWLRERGVNELI